MQRAQWHAVEGSISQFEVLKPLTGNRASLVSVTVCDPQGLLMLVDAPKQCFLRGILLAKGWLGRGRPPLDLIRALLVDDDFEEIEAKQVSEVKSKVTCPVFRSAGGEGTGQA